MIKPIIIELPYPSFNLQKDIVAAQTIFPAYAAMNGELNAILQYTYHHLYFEELDIEIAEILSAISIAEMKHFEILGKTLLMLGIDPVFSGNPIYKFDYYSTKNVNYSKTPHKMLLDDLSGEMLAVKQYEEIIKTLNNEQVAAIISRIKLDEELHIKVLKDALTKICDKKWWF